MPSILCVPLVLCGECIGFGSRGSASQSSTLPHNDLSVSLWVMFENYCDFAAVHLMGLAERSQLVISIALTVKTTRRISAELIVGDRPKMRQKDVWQFDDAES